MKVLIVLLFVLSSFGFIGFTLFLALLFKENKISWIIPYLSMAFNYVYIIFFIYVLEKKYWSTI